MNKLWALLKITILNEFGINKFKDKKIQGKIKDISMLLLISISCNNLSDTVNGSMS